MSRYFSKFAASLMIVLGLVSVSRAQTEVVEKSEIIRPLTKAGSAAFLFTIQGLGSFGIGAPAVTSGAITAGNSSGNILIPAVNNPAALQNQVSGGAGMKYYFSDDLALRVLLNFGTQSTSAASNNKSPLFDSGKATLLNLGIGAGVEYHFRPLYSTSPYIGGMLNYTQYSIDNGQATPNDVKVNYHGFGVTVLAGFDWFFTRGIAAGAEYGLGFSSAGATQSGSSPSADGPTTTVIGFMSSGGVHLVVYF